MSRETNPSGKVKSAEEMVGEVLKYNSDVLLVLQVAARAQEMEGRELPRELGASTEVAAIPCNPQIPVSWGVLHNE
ncbi:MAG: hypothetical protein ACREBW_08835 [Candidatus Micrarchaeaceae archaeon]